MKTTATVEQDHPNVTAVHLIYETKRVVIAKIDTVAIKRPDVRAISGITHKVRVILECGSTVKFDNMPFERGEAVYSTGRYDLYIVFFDHNLLQQLSFEGGKTLWELDT